MAKANGDSPFVPLAKACAECGADYFVGWRLVTSGKLASQRDGRGRWYVRVADLRSFVVPVPVGGAA